MALLTAEFGPYVAADYVDDGYADDSSIRVTAALTCDGNIYRFVAVNEAYPAYTWDSTGVWDDWPDNIWGGEGVTLPVRSSSSVTAAVTHAGQATAAVVALQTTAGNHIFAGRDISLAMTATQTTVGNHIFAGRDISLDMTATQTTVGNYIHKATGTLPVIYTVPSILAGVARFATVSMPGVFTESIDQSGLNGTAGIFFRATPATIQAFATEVTVATFIYRDPYRFLYVASETRVLHVPPREEFAVPEYTRLIKAIQETRTYTVPAESRTLAEGVPKYDNYRRRHL